ncbi:hypothetical protein GGR53DRAFT_469315 [Hypoxylon sp. FL1150]|nr:hypothetical protein GGR53DRAFT_469315 [Hypoxylon sp. FL1150]
MSSHKKNTVKRTTRTSVVLITDVIEQATTLSPSDGQSQIFSGEYEWLLRKLGSNPVGKTLTSRPYQFEQDMYKRILDKNIAKFNIHAPAPERIYQKPVFHEGQWVCLPDDADESFASYNRELSAQFYRDRDFFRAVVVSFWGPCVASVFPVISRQRFYIQIAFDEQYDFVKRRKRYELDITMFAYIMGRLRVIENGEPLAQIFGFRFVDHTGGAISIFETRERAMKDDTESSNEWLAILHKRDPKQPVEIHAPTDYWTTTTSPYIGRAYSGK